MADQAPEAFVAFSTALFATQPAEGTVGQTDPGSFVNWVGAATDRAAQDLGGWPPRPPRSTARR